MLKDGQNKKGENRKKSLGELKSYGWENSKLVRAEGKTGGSFYSLRYGIQRISHRGLTYTEGNSQNGRWTNRSRFLLNISNSRGFVRGGHFFCPLQMQSCRRGNMASLKEKKKQKKIREEISIAAISQEPQNVGKGDFCVKMGVS